jgi:internalin A
LQSLEYNKPRALAKDALISEVGEVVVFACAAPTHRLYAEKLIKELLATAANQLEPRLRRAIEVIALRCDAAAPVLAPKLRDQLTELADRLFPPTTFDEAQQLAVLGDAAVPRLHRAKISDIHAAAAIRCLRVIGSEPTRSALDSYRDVIDADALEELVQVFDPLTLPAILAAAQDHGRWSQLRSSIKQKINRLVEIADCTETTQLYLSGTNIEDISPLARLSKLAIIDFNTTKVKNLSTISSLAALTDVILSNIPIDDLRPLADLPQLSLAGLHDITADLSPLSNCTALRALLVGSGTLERIDFVEAMSKLNLLGILHSKVTDLSAAAHLGSLTTLHLWNSNVQEVWALHKLTSLVKLDLQRLPMSDLLSLRELTSLTELQLCRLLAVDLGPLSTLENLKRLTITEMQVKSLAPLSGLSHLETLDITNTQVESLEPIMFLPGLSRLIARETKLTDNDFERFAAAVPGRTVDFRPQM